MGILLFSYKVLTYFRMWTLFRSSNLAYYIRILLLRQSTLFPGMSDVKQSLPAGIGTNVLLKGTSAERMFCRLYCVSWLLV